MHKYGTLFFFKYIHNIEYYIQCFLLIFVQGMDKFETDLTTLHPILTECRVIKSDLELSLIQFANDISSEAHVEVIIIFYHKCLHYNYKL